MRLKKTLQVSANFQKAQESQSNDLSISQSTLKRNLNSYTRVTIYNTLMEKCTQVHDMRATLKNGCFSWIIDVLLSHQIIYVDLASYELMTKLLQMLSRSLQRGMNTFAMLIQMYNLYMNDCHLEILVLNVIPTVCLVLLKKELLLLLTNQEIWN